MVPDTWLPTSTFVVGLSGPLLETVFLMSPIERSTNLNSTCRPFSRSPMSLGRGAKRTNRTRMMMTAKMLLRVMVVKTACLEHGPAPARNQHTGRDAQVKVFGRWVALRRKHTRTTKDLEPNKQPLPMNPCINEQPLMALCKRI